MFYSVLYPDEASYNVPRNKEIPAYFIDLNLDQIFKSILMSKQEYDLGEYFYTPVSDRKVLEYRKAVSRDLEDVEIKEFFADFSAKLFLIGEYIKISGEELSERMYHGKTLDDGVFIKRGKLMQYAGMYCDSIKDFNEKAKQLVEEGRIKSEGLKGFVNYLKGYESDPKFGGFSRDIDELRDKFKGLHYCMYIRQDNIRVSRYEQEEDISGKVLELFKRFKTVSNKTYLQQFSEAPLSTDNENQVLKGLSKIFKSEFDELKKFCDKYSGFVDETIVRFSREIMVYLTWFNMMYDMKLFGLNFCYPELVDDPSKMFVTDGFDLALAREKRKSLITNSFEFKSPERIFVISGPNNGGKTTFARQYGQLNYLGQLGLPVPGSAAATMNFDEIYTHFGIEEKNASSDGKLQDDLVRLKEIIGKATKRSIIIINEIFSSTTLTDALTMGGYMMDSFAELGAPCLVVTFLDELASHGPETVSLMSNVYPDHPEKRTYKIIRKPADGLAFAIQIAGVHELKYEQIMSRLKGAKRK